MSRRARWVAACVIGIVTSTAVVVHGQATGGTPGAARYQGRRLAEALADLQSRGLRIIYSTEVVRPDMRVATEPGATPLRRILDALLAPHGLIAQDGPGGSVLIVKNPRVRVPNPAPARALDIAQNPPAASTSEGVEIPRYAETIAVTAEPWGAGAGPPPIGVQPLDVRGFAGGFENIFRTLQALPGVAGTDEFGSRIAVRGGSPDQNLAILDGIEIHNPYRVYVPSEDLGMSALVSAFNLETIESVELSPGAFDVRYGDRLSSLLVVKSREGSSSERFQGSSFLSLTDANVIAEGRLPPRARGSWLLSARRTHFDLVAQRVIGSALPSFHDLSAKVSWHPRAGQRVSLLGMTGRERTRVGKTVAPDDEVYSTRTHNNLLGLTWESTIGRRATSQTIVSFSQFDDALGGYERSLNTNRGANTAASVAEGGLVEFRLARDVAVSDVAVRQELGFRPSARHALDLGVDAHWLDTRWAWRISGDRSQHQANGTSMRLGASLPEALDSSRDSHRMGAWVQDRVQVTPRFAVQPGLRVDRSSMTARTTLSPRVSAAFDLGARTRLAGAVRLHSQTPGYEKLFQSDYFLDLTGPATLKPERALHATTGVQHQFGRAISVRVDAYYRRFDDLIVGRLETEDQRLARMATYDVPASLLASVPARAEITTSPTNGATGNAYGVEMHLAHDGSSTSPLTGWATYSFGRATRATYGVTHPFDYDRRHAISVAANLKIGPRLDLATTARWGSGFPRTRVSGVRLALVADADDADGDGNRTERVAQRDAAGNPLFQPDLGDLSNINSARLPHFARLDARLTYRPSWSRERWAFYVDVMNVLNRKNVVLIDTALALDHASDRPRIIELGEEMGIPFFPSFGIRFWF